MSTLRDAHVFATVRTNFSNFFAYLSVQFGANYTIWGCMMILGYLALGAITGMVAFGLTLGAGKSFFLAFLYYSLVGSVVTLLVPAAQYSLSLILTPLRRASQDQTGEKLAEERPEEWLGPRRERAERAIRILAVDDDPFILGLVPIISANAGFSNVNPVSSGASALEAIAGSQHPYDCILLDISMPGMDGIELCKRIRELDDYRHTPIIMLTGMRDMKAMDRAFKAGATDYVTKPFDVIELSARLRLVKESIAAASEPSTPLVAALPQAIVPQNEGVELSGDVDLAGPPSLVEQAVLSNYLSRLSAVDAARTDVFAVKVDRIDAIHTGSRSVSYTSVLGDVALALEELIGAEHLVMAYAGGGTFLIATNRSLQLLPEELETEIGRLLDIMAIESSSVGSLPISVSVGRPVTPRGKEEQRSGSAFGRAVALANSRALGKQGGGGQIPYRLVG